MMKRSYFQGEILKQRNPYKYHARKGRASLPEQLETDCRALHDFVDGLWERWRPESMMELGGGWVLTKICPNPDSASSHRANPFLAGLW
jgi:hypothetical protein